MVAALVAGMPAGAQDAGLWPVEKEQKDRALLPAGAQKAKALALYIKATRALEEGGTKEALTLFKDAMALDPGNGILTSRVASLTAATGRPDEARRLLEDAVKRRPRDEAPLLALTHFLVARQGENAKARAEAFTIVRQ